LWHGLADQHISPLNTITYFQAVERFLGAKRTQSFNRLYLFPGMYHCSDGEGPNRIDLLTPMCMFVMCGLRTDPEIWRVCFPVFRLDLS
jgi:feruloyl esterase